LPAGSPSSATTDDIMWVTRDHEPSEHAHGLAHLSGAAAGRGVAHEVRRAPHPLGADGAGRRGDLRTRVAHRLGRRLFGAAPQTGDGDWAGYRSVRRQASDV